MAAPGEQGQGQGQGNGGAGQGNGGAGGPQQAAAPVLADDRLARIESMLVRGEERSTRMEERQSQLESATRCAALSSVHGSLEWSDRGLKLAHGMLVAASNLIDNGVGKNVQPAALLSEVKQMLSACAGELEGINDKEPKNERAWEKKEKEIVESLMEIVEGSDDQSMIASLLKTKKRKEREKREKKSKSKSKSKRGSRGKRSDSESDSGDDSDRHVQKRSKCSLHPKADHDDSECLVQKGMRRAQAVTAYPASFPQPFPASAAVPVAAPATPVVPQVALPTVSGYVSGRWYCAAPCKRFHPPPPAPCFGPTGSRGLMAFAAGAPGSAAATWYAPFVLAASGDETVTEAQRDQHHAVATSSQHAQTPVPPQPLPRSLEQSVQQQSMSSPLSALSVADSHDVLDTKQKAVVTSSSRATGVVSKPNPDPVATSVGTGGDIDGPLEGKLSFEEALNAARIECVEEEGDFATRAVSGPLIPEMDSAVGLAPFTLAQLEAASFNRKMFIAHHLSCKFCAKSGHDYSFCCLRPNEKPPDRQIAFVEALCSQQQVDVLSYRGKTLEQAQAMLTELGDKLNQANPWSKCTQRSKQLKAALGYWKAIGANKAVLSFIGYGIPLRFALPPGRFAFRNHRSAMQHAEWVQKELAENVRAGFFVEVSREKAIVVNPLQVEPKGKNDLRMCVDSRWVNFHLPTPNVRFETPQKNGPDIIMQGSALFTADVKKAYYALEMDEEAIPYLCFEFAGKVYASLVLIFGLNLAPGIFHKVMRELVRFLRTLGISVLNYLDDFLFSESWAAVDKLVQFVRWLLPKLGWAFSEDKCVWTPASIVVFFGLLVDAERFQYRVPADKLGRVTAVISIMRERAQRGEPLAVHDLQVLTGTLQSYRLCIEPVQVWTRAMYVDIARACHASQTWASAETKEELDFWAKRLESLNGRTIAHPLATDVLQVDASDYGWGAVLNSTFKATGFLPVELIGKSSTVRELRGLRLAAADLASKLSGKQLRVQMDSFPAVRNLINGGGPVPELCAEVKEWWSWCEKRGLEVQYVWVKREENKEADRLSKADGRKWILRPEVKTTLSKSWQLSDLEFSAPEFGAVGFVLKLAQRDRRRIAIVYPGWPAQSWWPEIHKHARQVIELGSTAHVYEAVPVEKRIGAGEPAWRVFAALLDFRP